ncbi:MAG: hypothetical protein LBJ18_03645 [Rickettsiales bacterium]|jgi:hypothetical protein|nr:hypothetical protein [Rickettsiales bacterium]
MNNKKPILSEILALGAAEVPQPTSGSVLSQLCDSIGVPKQMLDRQLQASRANADMTARNYILGDTDDYWHRLAVAEQANKGVIPGRLALLLGRAKEDLVDLPYYTYKDGLSKALEYRRKDLQRNSDGYKIGRETPASRLSEVLEFYKNNSLKDWWLKYGDK